MSLFRPTRPERRNLTFQKLWGSGQDASPLGSSSADHALTFSSVYAAVRLISDSVASLPLQAFRKRGDSREQITPPQLLKNPTLFGTSYDWVHRAMTSLLLRGNAFGLITTEDGNGIPTQIEWLDPDEVTVDDNRATVRPSWRWLGRPLSPLDVLHIPGFTMPGRILGLSPIQAYALTLDTGLFAQHFGRNWFRDGGHPTAVLMNDGEVNEDLATRVKHRFQDSLRGNREPVVMGGGWKYAATQVKAEESQFLATIKATKNDIASIYGIPPHRIGGDATSGTYQNIEQDQINFVTMTLRPHLVKFEAAISEKLPESQFVRFNADAIVRADLNARFRAHDMAIRVGFRSVNDVRRLEDEPPIPEGNQYNWPPYRSQLTAEELGVAPEPEESEDDADSEPEQESDEGSDQPTDDES